MKTLTRKPAADRFMELVKRFPLRPIRNETEHRTAVDVLIELDGKPAPSDDEADYAATLALLLADYERPRVSLKVSVPQRLRVLMDERGLNTSRLGEIIGSRTAASMILNGQRTPSKTHIQKLAAYFKLNGGYFME